MFCSSCGVALSQHLKYCNRCGAHLATANEAIVKKTEKRLDEYLEGLFWLTVFGLGLILGGVALLQKLQIGAGFLIAYMVLSSAAFLVNFWLNLQQAVRLSRAAKEPTSIVRGEVATPKQLDPVNAQTLLTETHSITEHTTRELESIPKDYIRR